MPDRDVNVFKQLDVIFPDLAVGDFVITNGDSGFAQDRFFSGTIKRITGGRIEIAREDGQEGGSDEGWWLVKNKANSPIKMLILSADAGHHVPRSRIVFGDVIKVNGDLWLVMETLRNNRYAVKRFFRFDTDGTQVITEESRTAHLVFHFDEIRCYDCGETAIRAVNGNPYCETHIRAYGRMVSCASCGQTIWNGHSFNNGGDDERYCEPCYRLIREQNRVINNYSFKPEPTFISVVPEPKDLADKLFHGVENEVECPRNTEYEDEPEYDENDNPIERPPSSGTREDLAGKLKKIANKKRKWMYIKSDGSLNNGFEVVTEPATLAAHMTLPWDKICDFYKTKGFNADNTDTCGLHIHCNKNILKEEAQIKLAYFVATQRSKMERIARRPANRWALYKDADEDLTRIHRSSARYEALNWTPAHTVEFRLFKGTVDYKTLMSSLEFTQAIILFTNSVSMDILKNHKEAWKAYLKFCTERKYKFLVPFMADRGAV